MFAEEKKTKKCVALINSIEKALQCSICLDVFSDPVSVGCGHFFCRSCIGAVLKTKVRAPCPICTKFFNRRYVQEASQRKMIVEAAKKVISCVGQLKETSASVPDIPSPSVRSSLVSEEKDGETKLKETSKKLESLKVINEQLASENSESTKAPIRTKFYDKTVCDTIVLSGTSSEDFVEGTRQNNSNATNSLKKAKHSADADDSVAVNNCIILTKKCLIGKEEKHKSQAQTAAENDDPYVFKLSDDSLTKQNSVKRKTKPQKTLSLEAPKGSAVKQNVKVLPSLSIKRKKFLVKNVTDDDERIDGKKNEGISQSASSHKKVRRTFKNRPLTENSKKVLDLASKMSTCLTLEKADSTVNDVTVFETQPPPVTEKDGDENETSALTKNTSPLVSSTYVVKENVSHSSVNVEAGSEYSARGHIKKGIDSLLSETASIKSCQELVNNNNSLLKESVIDKNENINNESTHEQCETSSDVDNSVLPSTISRQQPVDEKDSVSRSPGWSRIKQMNKDFHLKKLPSLYIQKKTVHSPSVFMGNDVGSPCVVKNGFNSSDKGSSIPKGASNVTAKDKVSPIQDGKNEADNLAIQDGKNEVDNLDVEESSTIQNNVYPSNASKRLNFSHQNQDVCEVDGFTMLNTGPFEVQSDIDIDVSAAENDIDFNICGNVSNKNVIKSPSVKPLAASSPIRSDKSVEYSFVHNDAPLKSTESEASMKRNKRKCSESAEDVEQTLSKDTSVSRKVSKNGENDMIHASKKIMPNDQEIHLDSELSMLNGEKHKSAIAHVDTFNQNLSNESPKFFRIGADENYFLKHRHAASLADKSLDTSKKEKVVKRICLTLDEICAYFNESQMNKKTENICTVPLPFSDFKLQLTVADETLNISVLKKFRHSLSENTCSNDSSSFHLLKVTEPEKVTVKEFKDAEIQFSPLGFKNWSEGEDGQNLLNSSLEILPETQRRESTQNDDENPCELSESIRMDTSVSEKCSFGKSLCPKDDEKFNDKTETYVETAAKNNSSDSLLRFESDSVFNSLVSKANEICKPAFKASVESKKVEAPLSNLSVNNESQKADCNDQTPECINLTQPSVEKQNDEVTKEDLPEVKVLDEYELGTVHGLKSANSFSEKVNLGNSLGNEKPIVANDVSDKDMFDSDNSQSSKTAVNETLKEGSSFTNEFCSTKVENSKENLRAENLPAVRNLSPIESYLPENFDPFSDRLEYNKDTPLDDPVEAEFNDIVNGSENYSSDPDMIFATNLVAPLKNIAKREKMLNNSERKKVVKLSKTKANNSVRKNMSKRKNYVSRASDSVKKFRRISNYNFIDSSDSEELDFGERSKAEKTKFSHVIVNSSDIDDFESCLSPDCDKNEVLDETRDDDESNLKPAEDVLEENNSMQSKKEAVGDEFDNVLSCDEEPSETASKIEMEINEMKKRMKFLQEKLAQDDENEEFIEIGGKGNVENTDLLKSQGSNDLFSEQIPPTPPKSEMRTKNQSGFAGSIYKRNS